MVEIRANSKEMKCLDILSAHPQRASMVRSLAIAFDHGMRNWNNETRTVVASLLNALRQVHALSDLRMYLPAGYDPMLEEIQHALRSV
jgi:hypothetical protein